MKELSKKYLSPNQIITKAYNYCAYQERCQQEVRDKLYSWGLHQEEVESTIAHLISEGYINEERFAKMYAGGKFRIKKWGKNKIINELKARNITPYCIKKALSEINNKEYLQSLQLIINLKKKEIKEKNKLIKTHKIALYCISRGYESDLVWDTLKKQNSEDNL
ncbi:MAG TPA: regulatory protein RecX [Bacteroidales bacterium]|nr:regulatory protein RecX [Bacteroidales bacterium]HQI46673.1 regulatory protein RecX [Bacteroidales bacterium]